MKILFVHNFYGSEAPSGENVVVMAEMELLRKTGNEVFEFFMHSDTIRQKGIFGLLSGALNTPWSYQGYFKIKKIVADLNPDILHVHNTFPLISPAIFHAISGKVPVVLTLHNYRLFCAAGIPMRAGKPCTLCLDGQTVLPALRYRCYRNSLFATVPLAFSIWLHRKLKTWQKVSRYIALTNFQAALMAASGLPEGRILVKPNFFPGFPPVIPFDKRKTQVVFVGRLGEEKGVHDLLEAWAIVGKTEFSLLIIGDGPLRSNLEAKVVENKLESVLFTGNLPSSEVHRHIAESRLLVLPSRCFEGFPMVIREAYAFGTPVAVSNLGPLPNLAENGRLGFIFEPANPVSLAAAIVESLTDKERTHTMSTACRHTFEEKYTEKANYKLLMDIYNRAIND